MWFSYTVGLSWSPVGLASSALIVKHARRVSGSLDPPEVADYSGLLLNAVSNNITPYVWKPTLKVWDLRDTNSIFEKT